MPKIVVDSTKATLVYVCQTCKHEYRQTAWEVVENGTALCDNEECNNQDGDCLLERVEIDGAPAITKRHVIRCPDCDALLTEPASVSMCLSIDGRETYAPSSLSSDGTLIDTPDHAVAKGFHAGSFCGNCSALLEELE